VISRDVELPVLMEAVSLLGMPAAVRRHAEPSVSCSCVHAQLISVSTYADGQCEHITRHSIIHFTSNPVMQVISRDVELPVLMEAVSPLGMDPEKRAGMANAIGQELMQIMEFNKSEENRGGDRKICPRCYVLYR
jgi:hypothetical protein